MQYKHLSPAALWPAGDKSRKDYRRVCDSLPSSIYRIAMWIFFLWLFISCCGRCAWRLFLPPHPFCSGMLRRVRLSASSVILYTLFYLSLFCYPSPILPWDFFVTLFYSPFLLCYPQSFVLPYQYLCLGDVFTFTLNLIPFYNLYLRLCFLVYNLFLPETFAIPMSVILGLLPCVALD